METSSTISTVTAAEMRRIVAALAANLPPPGDLRRIDPAGTLCVHAEDSGEPAFVDRPCRGRRIECRKTGLTTYAAACRPDKCNFYEEDQGA